MTNAKRQMITRDQNRTNYNPSSGAHKSSRLNQLPFLSPKVKLNLEHVRYIFDSAFLYCQLSSIILLLGDFQCLK